METRKVERAAIKWPSGEVLTGRRHSDVYRRKVSEEGCIQGFVLDDGSFVTRDEAASIAFVAGQIPSSKSQLYSEDLW